MITDNEENIFTGKTKMTPKKAKWWNERAKALGGYAVTESIHTNKAADIFLIRMRISA